MPMWRCPHCGTPQAETARCWVCRRSSTACGTCRNFRRGIAAQLGYCGLDRRRTPLVGDEIRSCWEAAPVAGELVTVTAASIPAVPIGNPESERAHVALDFVEVGGAPAAPPATSQPAEPDASAPAADRPIAPAAASGPGGEPGWSFWAELEG